MCSQLCTFDFVNHRLVYLLLTTVALSLTACSRDPSPEAFLAPEFEQVSLDEHVAGEVTFVCRMSSMSQLTEYGLYLAVGGGSGDGGDGWRRVQGTKSGEESFRVCLKGLEAGKTYAYRLFIGNGRKEVRAATNYYTLPQ